jgi:hypothetical protein
MSKKKEWHVLKIEKGPQRPQFPPPFKPTQKLIDKLAERYGVHENPSFPDCPTCGMKYEDFRTGMDFQAVKDMLWTGNEDPDTWRYKRRNTVLGLWHGLKKDMWNEHLVMCQDPQAQADYLAEFDPSDFEEY